MSLFSVLLIEIWCPIFVKTREINSLIQIFSSFIPFHSREKVCILHCFDPGLVPACMNFYEKKWIFVYRL